MSTPQDRPCPRRSCGPERSHRGSTLSTVTTQTATLAEFLLARIAEDEGWARYEAEYGRFDRDRVLAECDAKRRIVEFYGGTGLHYSLQFLALPYADHPDYRPEWRPPRTRRTPLVTRR